MSENCNEKNQNVHDFFVYVTTSCSRYNGLGVVVPARIRVFTAPSGATCLHHGSLIDPQLHCSVATHTGLPELPLIMRAARQRQVKILL